MFYNLGARITAAHCCCSCNVEFRRLLVGEPSFRRGGIACQCSPLRRKFMDFFIINSALYDIIVLRRHAIETSTSSNKAAFFFSFVIVCFRLKFIL